MKSLDVGTTKFGERLKANYLPSGLTLQFAYTSGKHFPSPALTLSWEEWDRLVAWAELQRKEQALQVITKK